MIKSVIFNANSHTKLRAQVESERQKKVSIRCIVQWLYFNAVAWLSQTPDFAPASMRNKVHSQLTVP